MKSGSRKAHRRYPAHISSKLFIKFTYYAPSVIPDVGNRIVKKALNLAELIKYIHKHM